MGDTVSTDKKPDKQKTLLELRNVRFYKELVLSYEFNVGENRLMIYYDTTNPRAQVLTIKDQGIAATLLYEMDMLMKEPEEDEKEQAVCDNPTDGTGNEEVPSEPLPENL